MRILTLNYEFPPIGGGAGDVTEALCAELAGRGHEVKVITSYYKGLQRCERRHGFEVYRVPAMRHHRGKSDFFQMGCYLLKAMPRFYVLYRRWKPDVIHSHFLVPTSVLAFLAFKLLNVPFIVTMHGGDIHSFIPEQTCLIFNLIKPIAAQIGKKAAQLVAVSDALKNMAATHFPGLKDKITVVNNGTYLLEPKSSKKFPNLTLLFAGRLSLQKNLAFLLRSLARVKGNYRLIILGDGPEKQRLTQLTRESGIEKRVDFRGWVPRETVIEYMRKAHFFVMTSLREGMPVTVLQAYNCGLPVIGTDVEGLKEFIVNGKTGFLVGLGDEKGFAAVIEDVSRQPLLSSEMSQHCREFVRKFSWPSIAQQYEKIFLKIHMGNREGHFKKFK